MTDVVLISLEAWDEVWRRNQHLVTGLLRSGRVDRVLFVEPPRDVLHALRRGRRPELGTPGPHEVHLPGVGRRRLWTWRPYKALPRRLDPGGDSRRARRLGAVARTLGMTDPILWVNDPDGAAVLRTSGWRAVYDITDDWIVADRPEGERTRLTRNEAFLMERCEVVVVCSPALQETKSASRDVVLVQNAVDLTPYRDRQPRPRDLPEAPVALYLGTAHRDRLDVDLVVRTAEALRAAPGGARVCLVGPAPLPRQDLDRLGRAGVTLLGARPSDTVPAYLQHADVLLVPHVLTEFTASLDPIKAYEYRAARRPVVATPVPGFADLTDPLVHAVPAEAFPAAVVGALDAHLAWDATPPQALPSWADRAVEMAAVLDRMERSS